MKALLLAAGKSTRIASMTGGMPKPLLELHGTPVITHNLKLLQQHGVRKVWVNLHYRPEAIQGEVGDGKKWGITVRYSFEKELLGTAGAVKKMSEVFSEDDFFVLYGDNFTNCDLTALMKDHKQSQAMATVAVFDSGKALHSGIAGGKVLIQKDGSIEKFMEGPHAPSESGGWVNAGIYALQPEIIRRIPDGFSDFGKEIFPTLLEKGVKVKAHPMSGFCLGLDTPEAFKNAQEKAKTLSI